MEESHHRGKWKKKCSLCIVFLQLFFTLTRAVPQPERGVGEAALDLQNNTKPCSEDEYLSDNKICCNKCLPGYKLKQECQGKDLRSKCEKCKPGTFQSKANYFPNCFSCNKCNKRNDKVITQCTHTQDTVCGCDEGFYKRVIGGSTTSCERCKECRNGEWQTAPCHWEKDTTCELIPTRYPMNKTNHELDVTTPFIRMDHVYPTPHPKSSTLPLVLMLACCVILMLAVGPVYYICKKITHWKSKHALSSQSESCDPENQVRKQDQMFRSMHDTVKESNQLISNPQVEREQDQALPDCVPREIKTHDFIYYVLNQVPVSRFKELVRHLNVSEQDIERAERDNRTFFEAQYQMMKVWIDSHVGGGKSVVSQPLLQECLDRLRDMYLNGCAESIENKYCNETLILTHSSCM